MPDDPDPAEFFGRIPGERAVSCGCAAIIVMATVALVWFVGSWGVAQMMALVP